MWGAAAAPVRRPPRLRGAGGQAVAQMKGGATGLLEWTQEAQREPVLRTSVPLAPAAEWQPPVSPREDGLQFLPGLPAAGGGASCTSSLSKGPAAGDTGTRCHCGGCCPDGHGTRTPLSWPRSQSPQCRWPALGRPPPSLRVEHSPNTGE